MNFFNKSGTKIKQTTVAGPLTVDSIKLTKGNAGQIKERIKEFQKTSRATAKAYKSFLVGSGGLRLLAPLFIFQYPLWSFLAFTFFDWADYYPSMKIGLSNKKYNARDKLLDFYSYIFMTLYTYGTSLFPLFLGLLIFRLIGTALFYLYNNKHFFLFLFPNLIEPAFLTLILTKLYSVNAIVAFVILFILKMSQEYIIHILYVRKPVLRTLELKIGKRRGRLIINKPPIFD